MNKHHNDLIAIKTKHKKRAKFIAHNFAQDTYDLNEAGEKILVDDPSAVGALERAYYKLCTSDLPCVWITLTADEASGFPRNFDLNENTVCTLAAIHRTDGCYGYSIGKCDVYFLDTREREREATKKAIDLAFGLATNSSQNSAYSDLYKVRN